MRNSVIDTIMKNEDEETKQQLIENTAEAVREHVKYGQQSNLCKNLLKYDDEMKKFIEERFNEISIQKRTYESIMKNTRELIDSIYETARLMTFDDTENKIESFARYCADTTAKVMSEELKAMAYISHLNAMSEIIKKEKAVRTEEKEFSKIKKEIPQLEKVFHIIETNRRMPYYEISIKCEIPVEDVDKMIRVARSYFVVSRHPDPQKKMISLSQKGKRFYEFVEFQRKKITRKEAEEYVIVASESIIASFHDSRKCKVFRDIQIVGVQPKTERQIKYAYKRVVDDMLSDTKDTYSIMDEKYTLRKPNDFRNISVNGGHTHEVKYTIIQ